MKTIFSLVCLAMSSLTWAEHMPSFIQVDNYYVYRMNNNNGISLIKVLRIDKDWMYVEHYRKRDSYQQNFWLSINNKNIKYISNCKDKNLHESEKKLCDTKTS